MADERELEVEETGVDAGVEESTAPATAEQTDSRQPEQDERKINLDDSPEFRKWKAESDRKFQEQERRYQQMMAQQAQELRNRQMAEMDDYQRLEFELSEARQREQYAYQRIQEVEMETQKQRVLAEVSSTMGVPMDVLQESTDSNDAWRRAALYQRQSEQQRAAQAAEAAKAKAAARADKQQRNAVDTGTGTPIGAWDTEYRKVRQAGNARNLFAFALDSSQRE